MQYKTRGIILKRTNLGEADRIVTILTEKFGKIRAVAKGVRKTLSKMAGHLEPFCLTRLELAEGRNLDIICGAEVQKCFFDLRNDLDKTNVGFYLAEIIDKMVEERQPHIEIFDLLDLALGHTNDSPDPLLISFFEINFLSHMGFAPELYHCLNCQQVIVEKENYFDYNRGGLVCIDCGSGKKISAQAIKLIRLLLKNNFSMIKKIKIDNNLIIEVQTLTSQYLKHIHQNDFKSERFLTT